MASSNRINLHFLKSEFTNCLKEPEGSDEDILMQHYINAYNELLQILKVLGSVFYFVVQDVQDKLNILSAHVRESPDNYGSLVTMVHYERDNGRLTRKGHPPNGSRTYLRLHRALLFMIRFIQELTNENDHTSLGSMTQTVYSETLAQHHPWLLRKSLAMAVHTLPCKDDFVANLCRESGLEGRSHFMSLLRENLSSVQMTYAVSQRIYAGNELLNLD